jgi:hypothetical protein
MEYSTDIKAGEREKHLVIEALDNNVHFVRSKANDWKVK